MPAHIPLGELPEASPMVIAETDTHVTVAFEISKDRLRQWRRFLEILLTTAAREG